MENTPSADAPALPPDAWRENVAAIVLDAAGRVLLGLGTGGNAYWHFPQGGVGGKETAEAALRRELQEEVGLPPEAYRILASYGGLRYRYRKGNEKSGRWRGQEQTYYLILCHVAMPATDCSQTNEFSALTWVPWRELSPELFAPFKRNVVEKVLAHFFPPHLADEELLPYITTQLTPRRYRLPGGAFPGVGSALSAPCAADDRSLFGGGKEEMATTLERLALRLRAAHKALAASGGKLLVLLLGAPGSGRKQCLRRLAASLDPLHLRAAEVDAFTPGLPWELTAALPPAGGLTLALHREARAAVTTAPQQHSPLWEPWLTGQGVRLLKLYLHAEGSAVPAARLAATGVAAPWYIIPAERRWYRDWVAASLLVEALEDAAGTRAPLLFDKE